MKVELCSKRSFPSSSVSYNSDVEKPKKRKKYQPAAKQSPSSRDALLPHHLQGKLDPSLLHNGFLYDLDNFKENIKKGKKQQQKPAIAKKSKTKPKLPPPKPPRPFGGGPTKRPKR